MSERQKDTNMHNQNNDWEQRINLAIKITRIALKNLNIPELQEYEKDENVDVSSQFVAFYEESGKDIVLRVEVNPKFISAYFGISLSRIVLGTLNEWDSLLSNKKIMEWLQLDEFTRQSQVYQTVLDITEDFIRYLPRVTFHSIHQAVIENNIDYIKKVIDPDIRKNSEGAGKTKKFSLLPNNNLNDLEKFFPNNKSEFFRYLEGINKEYSTFREIAIGGRKAMLNQQAFEALPNSYNTLKAQYKDVKKEYNPKRKEFFKKNRSAEIDHWKKHWADFCLNKFPFLFLFNEVEDFNASELAYRHLAQVFDFNPDYMIKLVRSAKQLAKRKAQLNNQKIEN